MSLFAVLLFMAGSPQTGKTLIGLDPIFGLDPAQGEDARVTGPLSAIWYLVFILPMFLFTPDIRKSVPIGGRWGRGCANCAARSCRLASASRCCAS